MGAQYNNSPNQSVKQLRKIRSCQQ